MSDRNCIRHSDNVYSDKAFSVIIKINLFNRADLSGERKDTFDRSLCGCRKCLCVTKTSAMFAESNKGISKLYQNNPCVPRPRRCKRTTSTIYPVCYVWYAWYVVHRPIVPKKVTRITKATTKAVMQIVLPEMFHDVTFFVFLIGA